MIAVEVAFIKLHILEVKNYNQKRYTVGGEPQYQKETTTYIQILDTCLDYNFDCLYLML